MEQLTLKTLAYSHFLHLIPFSSVVRLYVCQMKCKCSLLSLASVSSIEKKSYSHSFFIIAMRVFLLLCVLSYNHACSLCRPFYRSWARYGKGVKKINIFFKHLIWKFKGLFLLSCNCNNYFQGGFPPWLLKDYTANYMPRFRTMKNAGKGPEVLL